MKSKILLYGICTILLIINFVTAGPKHTGWPLEVLSWDIDKAYPGIEYNYKLGVKGGEYPYNFTLVDGPSGMTINKNSGEIVWTPTSLLTDTVVIKISDMIGNSLVHRFAITSTKTGFYFVDGAKGVDNTNTGSESSPWKTMTYASKTAGSSGYIYVKKGTYNETFTITATDCGRIIAYPGDSVLIVCPPAGNTCIGLVSVKNGIFQGLTCDANDRRWFFNVSGSSKNIIWRKNEMRNTYDITAENPCFIFFGNQNTRYTNMLIQDNVFHDLDDPKMYHGSSVTYYAVENSLYEGNHAYDIDGDGVHEKVGGKRNTFRNNIIHDIRQYQGIRLNGNPSSDSTEICYNLIYDCSQGILIGSNGTYVANIFVHHNTVISQVAFSELLIKRDACTNVNVYKNIIGRGKNLPYGFYSSWDGDAYPVGFRTKVLIDSNIVFGPSNGSNICGGVEGGLYVLSWSNWQDSGKDVHSKAMQLQFGSDNIPILPDSLKIYGHFGSFGSFGNIQKYPTNITQTLPNSVSPDKNASEVNSLFQEIANNVSKGTRLSFKLQDETVKMAKIEIFSLTGKLVSRIIMDATGHVISGDKMLRNGRYFVVLSLQNSIGKESVFKQVVSFK